MHTSLSLLIIGLTSSITFWMISLIWIRMVPFIQHLSIAETIGSVYGKYPRVITALLSTIDAVGVVAIQIKVMSSMISICIDIDNRTITVLAALVLIAYTTFGSIRGVTNRDLLQFITFTAIILLITRLMYLKTGKSVLETISFLQKQEKFTFSSLLHPPIKILCLVICFSSSLLESTSPPIMQSTYICASPMQVKKVFLYNSLLSLGITFFICSISLLVFVNDPTLSAAAVWNYIIADMSPFLKTCIVICIIGAATCTADSYLHMAGIMIGYDLTKSIRAIKPSDKLQIRVAKVAAAMVTLLAVVLAIHYNNNDLYEAIVSIRTIATDLYLYIVPAPFILAIFGFRGTSRTVLMGIATAILTRLLCKRLCLTLSIGIDLVHVTANGLGMMAAHYLLPQPTGTGWMPLNNQQKRLKQLTRAFKRYKKG